MKLGEQAMPQAGFVRLPSSVQTILIDVSEYPDSSISQIVGRTGFPQSIVSEAVARLRDRGALITAVDPKDRRRTLVRLSPDIRQRMRRAPAESIAPAIGTALGIDDADELAEVLSTLQLLASRFSAAAQQQTDRGAPSGARREN
jgi:DNA-binding MarR family transcriptional regulator